MNRSVPLKSDPAKQRAWRQRSKGLAKRSAKGARRERERSRLSKACIMNANGLCQCCFAEPAVHAHHVRLKSQGGADSLDNLVALGVSCHDRVHREPAWAATKGLIVMNKETEEEDAERWDGMA